MPKQMMLMGLPDPGWLEVLRAQAEKPGVTKQAIANEIGVSRTAVSLLIAGKYTARTDKVQAKIANKVMALYADQVWCPHLHAAITPVACRTFCSAPMSISDPSKLKHWRACRACPHNPLQKDEVNDAV